MDITKTEIAGLERPPKEFYDADDSDNTCVLCGDPDYELVCDISHFGIPFCFRRCQCGLVKQAPMPNEKFFEWFFNSDVFFSSKETDEGEIWGYYDYFKDEPSRLATSRSRYKRLRAYFPENRVLEIMKIGPGTGTFLHVAREHGHHAMGCDVSNRFRSYATENYGVHIDLGRFERQPYKDGQFDILLLLNVVENVPNLDEFMAAIQRTVKKDGLFILNVVDMHRNVIAALQRNHYFLYRPPVCYIFTLAVLTRMLRQYGFEVVDTLPDIRFMHLEKISTLLRWRWLLRLSRAFRISRFPFHLPAYPSKIVVAKRVE